MPEFRSRRMVTPLKIGFGMRRRISSPAYSGNGGGGGVRRPNRAVKRCRSVEDDKENIPPLGYTRSVRKSPLPDWYPRTPLRDITAIVNAIERKNRRQQLFEEEVERTPFNVVDQTEKKPLKKKSEEEKEIIFFTSPCDDDIHVLLSPGEESSSSLPSSSSSSSNASTSRVSPPPCADSEEKLTRTIDTIEKMMKERLKKYPKDPMKVMKRTTLMSMR